MGNFSQGPPRPSPTIVADFKAKHFVILLRMLDRLTYSNADTWYVCDSEPFVNFLISSKSHFNAILSDKPLCSEFQTFNEGRRF